MPVVVLDYAWSGAGRRTSLVVELVGARAAVPQYHDRDDAEADQRHAERHPDLVHAAGAELVVVDRGSAGRSELVRWPGCRCGACWSRK
ncbi:hypothetical protein [Dactylosporangium darangshiense]|uniref:hypothetical protein n=1 Tax=Dactylosporangium darangshiense TaxID=579108 RepID=UPI0031E9702B